MTRVLLFLLCVSTLALPPLMALAAMPRGGNGPLLLLHAPWQDGTALARGAGGWPVGPASAPMGMLVAADDPDDFRRLARAAGAWAVVDGSALARLCGVAVPAPEAS